MKPVTLLRWALIGDLNGLGEAVLTFTVVDCVLIVVLNPRTLEVVRVARLGETGSTSQLNVGVLPFGLLDLAQTIVAERFPQPTRHSAR